MSELRPWPSGGGEMAGRIRAHDWARTPLGPVEAWPQSLKTAVDLCLGSAVASFVWWGPELVQVYNDAALGVLRARHPRALGAPAREAWADVWEVAGPPAERVVATGEAERGEDLSIEPDPGGAGEAARFSFSYGAARDESGAVAGLFVTAVEAPAKASEAAARALERLRESEERFRLMADAVPQIVWITDAEGRVEFFNRQWSAYTGRPYEPTTAAEVAATVIHPDDAALTTQRFDEARGSGGTFLVEHRIRSASGEYRWFLVRGEPYRDPETGKIVRWFGASVDIHDRKLAEDALRESEARFRLIVEGARDYAIFTTDTQGRIENWSPGAEAVFGWSAEEAAGRLVDMTFTPEDRECGEPDKERREARDTGSAPDVRWHLRKDGRRVFIDGVTRALRGPGGGLRGFLKVGQDVTQRRQTEEALRRLNETLEQRVEERTAELAESNRALAAEIAERERAEAARSEVLRRLVTAEEDERRRISRELHDSLGQLVTGLLLGLKALERDAGRDPRIEDLERLADRIGREMQHMAVELRPPALDSLGLEVALKSHLEEWSERHGVEADFHSAGLGGDRLPPEVETTIYRVVQEGLTNVLKHAGATCVSLVLERRGGSVRAILEDDGKGFDVEATLASPGKAKRLGLRGMRERVALLGGELEIESSPESGTTVFVRLPDPAAPAGAGREGGR